MTFKNQPEKNPILPSYLIALFIRSLIEKFWKTHFLWSTAGGVWRLGSVRDDWRGAVFLDAECAAAAGQDPAEVWQLQVCSIHLGEGDCGFFQAENQ